MALPQAKNQHLTALNKRRRLGCCTGSMKRRGRIQGTSVARDTFLPIFRPLISLFQVTLQTIFTPCFVVQFHSSPSQFPQFHILESSVPARLCLSAPCWYESSRVFHDVIASCFISKLQSFYSFSQFSWLVVPLRRCVGMQTPAAPEVQLRDVVWSDESFFRLREQPNHQNTRIFWGLPCPTIFCSFSQFLAHAGHCREFHFSHHECQVLLLLHFWLFCSVSVAAHVASACHSEGFGCRAALDDGETPLRLTASQTTTTRGVVSGIMSALDIAPTLHFVEPGLKINAEEWIKVMDEYIVPNCTAPMEPGRKFFIALGQRAVARFQAGLRALQHSAARHSRVSTTVFPRSFSHRLLFVERAQSTACSASSSCQSR